MPQFQIEVGGNIAPVVRSISDLKARLRELKFEIERSTDAAAINVLNAELRETEAELRRIRGIGPIIPPAATNSVNSATQSLTNIGRVAQDLPFGFIGIANNLNPLLESFQRLRAETGSGRAALQALGSSLLGPGGLGIALSLLTAGLSFMSLGLQAWGVKAEKAKKDTDEFIKSLKTLDEVAASATGSQAGEIAKVQALADVIQNTNNSYKERKRAIEELKEVNKSYFGDLTLEASHLATLTQRVNEYSQALIAEAVLKGFTEEVSRVSVELAKQDRVLRKNADEVNRLRTRLEVMKQSETSLTGEDRISEKYVRTKKALEDANKAFGDQVKVVNTLKDDVKGLTDSVDDAVKNTLKFKDLNTPGADKKGEDALKKRLELLERIKKSLKDPNELVGIQEQIFQLQVKIAIRDDKKRLDPREFRDLISGFQKQLNDAFLNQAIALEAIPKIKFSPVTSPFNINEILSKSFTSKKTLELTIGGVKVNTESVDITDLKNKVSGAVLKSDKITITLHDIRLKFLGDKKTKILEGTEALNKQLSEDINNSMRDLQIDVAGTIGQQLGESFATALQGGDLGEGLKTAAKALLGILGNTMQQIGRQVIGAAIKIQLLKKALQTWAVKNPALAIAAGIGLVAAGAALKAFNFEGPKFAAGGIVNRPTIGMIGEAGPEAILPLNKLNQVLGNRGSNTVILNSTLGIRGREIVAFIEQETNRFNRLR